MFIPVSLSSVLLLQQFLTMLNGSVAMPLMVTPLTCMADDDPARGYIIGATLFVSGITTLLQATFGTRLPIVQGPSWTYLAPIAAVMQLPQWKCPDDDLLANMSSEERSALWQPRVNELLGALAVASVIQLLLGATGAVGLLLRFISPITVVCTITVLGIGFFESFRGMMSSHWPVSLLTDLNINALSEAVWLRVPLPGHWGAPTVHIGPVLGMTAAVLASIVESIGDYYACAKMSGASAPPVHAMNRGITIEGLGGILSGLFGAANASTSYSGNIGIIGVTRVGSRRVVQFSAVYMILFGLVGKFGALFVSIPAAIYGGAFVALFAMIAGMGTLVKQFLTMLNGSVAMPLMVTPLTCMADDDPARGYIIDATLFVSGITTLLQATFGTRVPAGPTSRTIAAVMHLPEWKCPDDRPAGEHELRGAQRAVAAEGQRTAWGAGGGFGHTSCCSVLTGAVGLLLRFISPITVVCTITVLGIGFFESFRGMMSSHWPVSLLSCCSKIVVHVRVTFNAVLHFLQSRPDLPPACMYQALSEAVWLQLPLIGRWGAPTVHIGPVLGMTAAVLASIVESIGDYYSCAKISGEHPWKAQCASAPPVHAMNRGIAIEGLGGILSGLFGAANASTSYSGNIGIIGVTR
ncbi:Solute carrier family 23 member 2 [Amphibalanus amphitrite]|uniref:Solute carrier family 23 member 2 n=1 Tax=Amphibalanus amphitrite TaxID=1232801 RepID=A0A6A4VZX6_AMPAM|nr:Solute carrier family 23 member 2 [Amphibalanus amphitrite]